MSTSSEPRHTPGPWTDDEAGFLGADGRPVGQPERGKPLLAEVPRVHADRALPILEGMNHLDGAEELEREAAALCIKAAIAKGEG